MRALALGLALLATPAVAQTVAIVHARAWTATADRPVEDATIVLANGRIVTIIAHGGTPSNTNIIDAAGHDVTPALMPAATQIGLVALGAAGDTDDRAVAAGPLGAAFDVAPAIDANALTIQVARAAGVARTMVFPGGANGVFQGQGAMLHLTGGPDVVERAHAALFVDAGGAAATTAAGGSRGATWTLVRNAFTEARGYRGGAAGGGGPRDQLLNHLDAAAIQPVLAGRMPLAVWADREADIRQALALAHDFAGVRLVILGGAEAWRAAPELAAAHVPVVIDPLDQLPISYDAMGARRDNAALLDRAGVRIAFSVSGQTIYRSYNAGNATREGAGIAVANGLPYAAAIRAMTANPAGIWSEPEGTGTLAAGTAGDLVVWDGDPLEPSSAPLHVLIDGREISPVTRQTLLRDRYRPGVSAPR